MAGVRDVPTCDAADTLKAVHDVAVHAKRIARLGNRRVVRLYSSSSRLTCGGVTQDKVN